MQYLDNDMDDLFKRAGEAYPLKAEPLGWNEIAGALVKSGIILKPYSNKKKIIGIAMAVFFIVMALPFITGMEGIDKNKMSIIAVNKISSNFISITNKKATSGRQPKQVILRPFNENIPLAQHQVAKQGILHDKAQTKERKIVTPQEFNEASLNLNKQTGKKFISKKIFTDGSLSRLSYRDSTNYLHSLISPVAINNRAAKLWLGLKRPLDTLIIKATATHQNKKNDTLTTHPKKFYAGLIGDLNLNQVKYQGYNKLGYSAGFVLGYHVNKRLSIETGLSFSKIFYSSNGKYFDMVKARAYFPGDMTMLSIKDCSLMLQVPLKINYTLTPNKKNKWFVSAAISSYILTKQMDNYYMMIAGIPQYHDGVYSKSAVNFASLASAGFGDEIKISKKITLRIEPFLQISLKGMGIGSMPVSSAGLHAGLIMLIGK